jgi:hypothetical protein
MAHTGGVDVSPGIGLLPLAVVIVVASLWGWSVVPTEARFPIRFGGFGFQTTISKGAALLLWPVLAAAVVGGVASASDEGDSTMFVLGLFTLVIMLIAQIASIRKAARS